MTKRAKQSGPAILAHWLRESGLTQSAAAAEMGIPQPHLSAILAGRKRPSLDAALRIANVAGVPPAAWAKE